jgi:hypothetical protein
MEGKEIASLLRGKLAHIIYPVIRVHLYRKRGAPDEKKGSPFPIPISAPLQPDESLAFWSAMSPSCGHR